jgi:glycine oxidase
MALRIVVVGGGITGAFATYFASRLGAAATLIERDRIGGQASGHNAGGLNPLHGAGIPGPMQELALESLRLHREHWQRIGQLSGTDFGARLVARLQIALSERETRALMHQEALCNSTPGFRARLLDAAQLRRREPRVRADARAALYTEGNARVDPGAYTNAVAAAAIRLGAKSLIAQAFDLVHRDGRVSAVVLGSGVVECDGVILAQGPWCTDATDWLGVELPVEPVKGELLLAEIAGAPLEVEITCDDVAVYAAANGRVWLGGTEDRVGFDPVPTRAGAPGSSTGWASCCLGSSPRSSSTTSPPCGR